MTHLVYSILNAKSLVVRPTDREGGKTHPFHATILGMKGRWFNKLQGGAGWVISRQKEEEVQQAIQQFSGIPTIAHATEEVRELQQEDIKEVESKPELNLLEDIEKHMKSRHNQKKYHRAVSDNEEEEDTAPVVSERIRYMKPKHSPKVEKYCKQFVQPSNIESDDSSDSEDSSSEEDALERSPPAAKRQNNFHRLKEEIPIIKREVVTETKLPRRKHREYVEEEVPRRKHREYVEEEVPRRKHREYVEEEVPRRKHREYVAEEVPRRKHREYVAEEVPRRKHRDVEEVPRRKHREESSRKSKATTIEQVSEQIEQLQNLLRQMK